MPYGSCPSYYDQHQEHGSLIRHGAQGQMRYTGSGAFPFPLHHKSQNVHPLLDDDPVTCKEILCSTYDNDAEQEHSGMKTNSVVVTASSGAVAQAPEQFDSLAGGMPFIPIAMEEEDAGGVIMSPNEEQQPPPQQASSVSPSFEMDPEEVMAVEETAAAALRRQQAMRQGASYQHQYIYDCGTGAPSSYPPPGADAASCFQSQQQLGIIFSVSLCSHVVASTTQAVLCINLIILT